MRMLKRRRPSQTSGLVRTRGVLDEHRGVAVHEQMGGVDAGNYPAHHLGHSGDLGVALAIPKPVAACRAVPAVVLGSVAALIPPGRWMAIGIHVVADVLIRAQL